MSSSEHSACTADVRYAPQRHQLPVQHVVAGSSSTGHGPGHCYEQEMEVLSSMTSKAPTAAHLRQKISSDTDQEGPWAYFIEDTRLYCQLHKESWGAVYNP